MVSYFICFFCFTKKLICSLSIKSLFFFWGKQKPPYLNIDTWSARSCFNLGQKIYSMYSTVICLYLSPFLYILLHSWTAPNPFFWQPFDILSNTWMNALCVREQSSTEYHFKKSFEFVFRLQPVLNSPIRPSSVVFLWFEQKRMDHSSIYMVLDGYLLHN